MAFGAPCNCPRMNTLSPTLPCVTTFQPGANWHQPSACAAGAMEKSESNAIQIILLRFIGYSLLRYWKSFRVRFLKGHPSAFGGAAFRGNDSADNHCDCRQQNPLCLCSQGVHSDDAIRRKVPMQRESRRSARVNAFRDSSLHPP